MIQRLRRPEDQHILELGCGSGQMLHRYTELGLTSTGVDGTRSSIERAALEAPEATVIHANVEALPLSSEQFDFVAAFDVLEHVEPLPFLNEARRVARTGARLLISVPASQWLWGPLDEAAGHRCRYDRPQLEAELRQSGWKPLGHTRYQFLLFPVILASRLMRASKAERHPPKRVGTLLGAVNAAEVRLLSGRRLPWGSSLMMWAEAA
ncbi:MAG: class I SAM-dependent methyltransferase [Proteobacteria bacterium]|nr:class I SAM-dependent methyltransferase [Pseudomonadota bacterium]